VSEHIKNTLGGFLNDLKIKQKSNQQVRQVLDSVFDENTRKHIQGYKKYKETLIIYVDSSMWSFQINLLKTKILEQIHHITKNINKISVKVRMK